jgi:hypothetical protein
VEGYFSLRPQNVNNVFSISNPRRLEAKHNIHRPLEGYFILRPHNVNNVFSISNPRRLEAKHNIHRPLEGKRIWCEVFSFNYKETTFSCVQNAVWGCVLVLASSCTKPTCISED